ncbi:related to metallo-beta-lactamase domain protein [Armillaria ostoyae]|uniref:Related to metallo-beta-lactamase domain protein n=1 Tax=Armillaria ostoyae TaxID=47428 RepID=A0A284QMG4_ARMOS|nr:related to metallo-beta-lactamase domain protein [Armillaria ostoyae]
MGTTSAAEPWTYVNDEKGNAEISCFFEPQTSTWQYLISDPATSQAVLVDTVLDYDPASGKVSTESADKLLAFIEKKNLKILRILETHAHADHLTAAQYLKSKLPGEVPVCIGSRITQVQSNFAPIYGLGRSAFDTTFDIFLKDDEEFPVGNLTCRVIYLPGHTPDHIGYVVGKAVFTGDSIFLPDVGSARVDFPGGNAKQLYASMNRLLSLPEDYKLFVGHDYPSGRNYDCVTTVGEQRKLNKHGKVGTTEEAFIDFRKKRDDTLGAPRLIHPSLQVNIRAGRLPPADAEGRVWMKVPVRSSISI